MSQLSAFPVKSDCNIQAPAFLMERGFSLRHAKDEDIPRLRQLYADTRAEEMLPLPWPLEAKQQFIDQQFDLQHRHYLAHYGDADFMVIEHEHVVQGRYYLLKKAPDHLVIDICLMGEQRGLGIGRALIQQSQLDALAMQHGMQLHVIKYNIRALALYEKLGFKICGGTDMHHYMNWRGNAYA